MAVNSTNTDTTPNVSRNDEVKNREHVNVFKCVCTHKSRDRVEKKREKKACKKQLELANSSNFISDIA